jgi:5S rRNA maturation endonuclease (ribonuclease M5)
MVGGIRMDIPESYRIVDKYKILIFADVDENGEFIEAAMGQRIVPNRQYQHFFFVDRYVQDTIENYKVVNGELVAKDAELENQIKQLYFQEG